TDVGMASIARLTKLKSLDLSGNQITDKGLAELGVLESVEELLLGAAKRNPDQNIGAAQAGEQSEQIITNWSLMNCCALGNHKKLKILDLTGAMVFDSGVKKIVENNSCLTKLKLAK